MVLTGILLVIVTFIAIIKGYETRLVLFVSGIIMCFIGGNTIAGSDAFIKEFTNAGLVPTICTVLGFSYVMDYTGCSKHMVTVITNVLSKLKFILIFGSVLVTFFVNIALPSAAGCAAAVGTLLIPALISAGVNPKMAAAAVFLGTWGSVMSPGLMFNPQIAQMAGTDVMTVIGSFSVQVLSAAVIAAIILTITAIVKKENTGFVSTEKQASLSTDTFKINYLHAILPVIPLVMLITGSKQIGLTPYVSVPTAMLIGTAIGFIVVRPNLKEATKRFFRGTGDGMCDIVGIIAAAACFTAGMKTIGLTDSLIDVMKNSQHIAQFASAFGPFIIGVISGTGNAAALAFNGAVTPHAADFGYNIISLGSMAQIGAGLGRTMSPVAGSAILIAKIANVNPLELSKRTALPTIIATLVVMFTLL
ncbi:C4-dicarboxylate transporter DcuC [Pectinatus cerevisiiphilus]|uniref:DcuC family C4-dicarboxylate transporter n=1 Tax=Pectinatus cerevisiiphilus TaxID=86956 RepID=A0A4R3K2X7_9FIRM|nr:C4-dicarboxylate transporter DcuC [Pectinatus cerevisiiphilus]TCS76778.1 DcuC family C4-dicarboxylate transporter [Pectinatus cerevisiiphilus]